MQKIVLATESTYKKSLFSRLNLDFISIAAEIDEKPAHDENAEMLARRLACQKAEKIACLEDHAHSWVIGADQCAETTDSEPNNKLVFKPESHEQAVQDLLDYSGNTLIFYTAACLISPDGDRSQIMDKTSVQFRALTKEEIEYYLRIEKPYDCAGAFMAEDLGISLFNSITSEDPTALIGLPLIKLSQLLRDQGFDCYRTNS